MQTLLYSQHPHLPSRLCSSRRFANTRLCFQIFGRGVFVTLPELSEAQIGPFFDRVREVAAGVPRALGAQGTFVAMNNIVSQSVPHLHVHVVPRTKGDGLRGFFWPRTSYPSAEALKETGDKIRRALTS